MEQDDVFELVDVVDGVVYDRDGNIHDVSGPVLLLCPPQATWEGARLEYRNGERFRLVRE